MNESWSTNVMQKVMFDFESNSKGNIITSLNTITVVAMRNNNNSNNPNVNNKNNPNYGSGTAMILYV